MEIERLEDSEVKVETLKFFHDKRHKKEFNLFEAIHVRDTEIDIKNRKIKIPGNRKRKFVITASSGGFFCAEFIVKKVKYYIQCTHNNENVCYC